MKIQPNMSEQEKTSKNLWLAWRRNQAKISLPTVYKAKKNVFTEKELIKEKWVEDWTINE